MSRPLPRSFTFSFILDRWPRYVTEHSLYSPAFFYVGRWIPLSAGQTKMEYEVYKSNDPAQEPAFQRLNDIFKVVLDEDKGLCNAAYRNVQSGIFSAGELHPQMEKVSSPMSRNECATVDVDLVVPGTTTLPADHSRTCCGAPQARAKRKAANLAGKTHECQRQAEPG